MLSRFINVRLGALAAIAWTVGCVLPAGAGDAVGIIWSGKSGMAAQIATALQKELQAKAPEIKVELVADAPSEDFANLKYQKWQSEKNAVVYLRSPGAAFMAKNPPKIPGFFGACSNPVDLGCLSALDKPDKNLTGSTYYIPASRMLEIIQKILPQAKTYGLLVDPGHPSSKIEIAETEEWLKKKGLNFKLIGGSNLGELITAARAAQDEVDLFITGNQSFVFDSSDKLVALLKKPMFSYSSITIKKKGTICAFDVDNDMLGREMAGQIIAAVKEGKPVAQIPVATDKTPKLVFVDEVVAKYGLTIPAELKDGK